MEEARRLQYLEALGVDVWLPIPERLPVVASLTDFEGEVEKHEEGLPADAFPFPHPTPIMTGSPASYPGGGCKSASSRFVPEGDEAIAGTHTHAVNIDVPRNDSVSAMDWDALQEAVAQCRKCGLCETRTQTVFGNGNRQAQWLLIGEAPGQQEDLQGQPFVGNAGQLLTEMLRAMGLAREEVFIANILKCRPPNNRDPKQDEMAACNPYIQRQIQLLRPKMILAIGRIAAQHLLQTDAPIGKLRSRVHYLGDIPLLVIYHPAYLLRSLLEKRKAWDDLQMALRMFRESCR